MNAVTTIDLAVPVANLLQAPRHVLSVLDLHADEVAQVCERAVLMRATPAYPPTLRGRSVGVYFRKTSTRTRLGFQVGAARLGAHVVALGPGDLQVNTGETLADTARVLAGYLDILVMRTNDDVAEMQTFAAQPRMSIVNALSADEHPTQAIADLATMLHHFGHLQRLSVLYCGEGNKTAASLALAMSRIPGARLTLAVPQGYGLDEATFARARALAARHGAAIQQIHDLAGAPADVEVVYTSRWQEMGVEKPDPDWKAKFAPFAVTPAVMERWPGSVVMHDLPAVRDEDVASVVLDGSRSLAWLQAEYKMYAAMAVMEWCAYGAAAPIARS